MIPTIDKWSYPLRVMTACFLVVLSVGFFTGIRFVGETDSTTPDGIIEHYNGNEQDEDVMVMKFKKSAQEMLTIVHTHILSMSMLFFLTGFLLAQTPINQRLKLFLIVEPFVSILLTFGGLYLIWFGLEWFRYIVIFSGIAMTLAYSAAVFIILKYLQLFKS
jgi:uncharacterized membrane protein SpoIIM required for sporulation